MTRDRAVIAAVLVLLVAGVAWAFVALVILLSLPRRGRA